MRNSLIPYHKEKLAETEDKLRKATEELSKLYGEREDLIKKIRKECSHPIEYQDKYQTNHGADPGECENIKVVCTACGHTLKEYDVFQGREINVKEYQC